VRLCPECHEHFRKGTASPQSIAGGVDFGAPDRLRLIPPTLLERALLADVRVYGSVLKIIAPSVGGGGPSANVVRGHFINFFQTGSEEATRYLTKERLASSFQVMFVGPEGEMDRLKHKALLCREFRVDTRRVLNWLIVRQALLPEHLGIRALEVPTLTELDAALGGLTEQLVAEARMVNDESELIAEDMVGQDVAEVRTTETDEYAPSPDVDQGASQGDAQTEELSLDHRAVVPRIGAQGKVANEEVVTSTLRAIQSAFTDVEAALSRGEGGPADGDAPEESAAARVTRSAEPVNEFEANDKLMYGVFWYEFILGKGLLKKGSTSQAARTHLQLQFSGRFARNEELNFLLANQVQRHAHAKSVQGRVRSDPTSFHTFAAYVEDQEFIPRLVRGLDNPNGADAAAILRTVQPFLTTCSQAVPYSNVARNGDVTKLMNMRRNFGLPSLFLTIAPDDVHNPLGIRMSMRTSSNVGFPAVDAGFAEALRSGAVEFHPNTPPDCEEVIPITNADLRRHVSSNPVAAGLVYNRMLEAVWTCLLGIEPVHMGGVGSKKSEPRMSRKKGLWGLLSAAFGANEEQMRRTLHQHIIGFGGPPPEVLQSLFPDMVRLAADLLGSMFQAHVAPEVHIAHMVRRQLHQPGLRHAFFESLDVTHASFNLQAQVSALDLGNHEHTPTCR
jgi:hypothetical protein